MGRYVTPEMVENRYGPYADDQLSRLVWLIEDAEVEVGLGRDLPKRIAAGSTSVDAIVKVVCELVNAEVRNPLGLRSQSQTTGSFTDQQTFAGDTAGATTLTTRQGRLLGDPRKGGAFTVRPGGDA